MNISTNYRLLVVDDDPLIIESLKLILPKNWQMNASAKLPPITDRTVYHAAFVDMHLTGSLSTAEGPDIIKQISTQNGKIEVVAISGDLSMELMERCLKSGASKFLAKPLLPDEVILTLEKIEALWQIRDVETRGGQRKYKWLGNSQPSEEIKKKVASFKGESGPILIEGETGTGKEVVFRLLNQQEANRPTITVNIASIPENLFESEIFGHVKGAFTGADSMKIGLTEAAHGGDLFLDEIEALPLSQQVKLLRFLETGEVRKVGAKESTIVKARVLVASNQNLSQLVKEGKFRDDLLFRLGGKKIQLPPLRERKSDVATLANYFISLEKNRSNKTLSTDALETLAQYAWPGNVRELKRICEQLVLASPLPIIRKEDVLALIQPPSAEKSTNLNLELGLAELLDQHEAQVIQLALKQCADVENAAELLKISRSSLYQKIKTHQIQEAP